MGSHGGDQASLYSEKVLLLLPPSPRMPAFALHVTHRQVIVHIVLGWVGAIFEEMLSSSWGGRCFRCEVGIKFPKTDVFHVLLQGLPERDTYNYIDSVPQLYRAPALPPNNPW